MASIDPFGRTDQLDDGMLAALVARSEARGRHPLFSQMLLEYFDAMNIAEPAEVEQANAWAVDLQSDSETGVFVCTGNYFAFVARSP